MARYKSYDLRQSKMIPLSYADQIVPGSFEYALNEIIEEHLDLTVFEGRYQNDHTGRRAYDPKVMLKIVLYGYSKGMLRSRQLEEACRRNVVFMALSADSRPHFTTIAGFVTEMHLEVVSLFRDVLLYCEELGLLGEEHFAIDGCKLSSNASKQRSGTLAELRERQKKMEKAAREIVAMHRSRDEQEKQGQGDQAETKKLATYRARISKIKEFLKTAKKNIGPSGNERKTNMTDPESAKMSTSRGVVQGFTGVAVVDERHQIVVHAEAVGEGQENHLLEPMVKAVRENFEALGRKTDVFEKTKLSADCGYHCKKSMEYIAGSGVDAYVADPGMRGRDPAFSDVGRHKERTRKEKRLKNKGSSQKLFGPADFLYDEKNQTCICPAGEQLYKSGMDLVISGYRGAQFRAPKSACGPCKLRHLCLRKPQTTVNRQVVFLRERISEGAGGKRAPVAAIEAMKRKMDSPAGRAVYSRRMATVEPVFANIQNKGMRRFTLRGRNKVSAQWMMYAMVHNIEKIANYG